MRIFSILKIIVWLWLIIKIVVFVWCVTVVTHCKCGLEFLDLNNMDNWFCFGMYLDKKTSFKRLFLFWSFFCCFSCCFFSCCFSCGFFLCCHYSNNIPHGFLLIKLTKIYKTSIIWITFSWISISLSSQLMGRNYGRCRTCKTRPPEKQIWNSKTSQGDVQSGQMGRWTIQDQTSRSSCKRRGAGPRCNCQDKAGARAWSLNQLKF